MTLQQISQQVRDLILQGELDDAANTLVQFLDKEWMSRADKAQVQLYNQALYQLSQLNELKHQVFAGIISNEDADLKRNRIRAVLLEISEELKGFEAHRSLAIEQSAPNKVSSDAPSKSGMLPWVWGIAALLVVLVLTWVIYQQQSGPKKEAPQVIVQKDTVLIPVQAEQAPPATGQGASSPKNKTHNEASTGTTQTTTKPPVNKPDLYVRCAVQPSILIADQPAHITVAVYNSGLEAAKDVEVLWWPTPNATPKRLVFARVPAGGGDTQSFDYTWYQIQGQVSTKVQVDPQNRIAEGNETNNLSSKDLNISKKAQR